MNCIACIYLIQCKNWKSKFTCPVSVAHYLAWSADDDEFDSYPERLFSLCRHSNDIKMCMLV